jgi:hypothetical protein
LCFTGSARHHLDLHGNATLLDLDDVFAGHWIRRWPRDCSCSRAA